MKQTPKATTPIQEDKLREALADFRQQYPSVNSADIQTFIIGWKANAHEIKAENEALKIQLRDCAERTLRMANREAELKEANKELLEALRRISEYKGNDSLTGQILKNVANKAIAKHSPKQ